MSCKSRGGRWKVALSRVAADEQGAGAVEYGLLMAFVAIVIIAGVAAAGTSLNAIFERIVELWPG